MENWNKFVKEGSFGRDSGRWNADSTFHKNLLDTDDFEDLSPGQGPRIDDPEIQDLIRYGRFIFGPEGNWTPDFGSTLDSAGLTHPDKDFMIAYVTGRLSHLGGPDKAAAKRKYGDHTDGQLFTRFQNKPTKFDKVPATSQSHPDNQTSVGQGFSPDADHPSDGPYVPAGDDHNDIHKGGAEVAAHPSQETLNTQSVIPVLKTLITKDLTDPASASMAKKILKSIIATLEQNQ